MRDRPYIRECIYCHKFFRTYSHRKVKRCSRPECVKIYPKKYHERDGLSDRQYYYIMRYVDGMTDDEKNELYEEVRERLMRE